jgi:thiol:disulfide interchange protein DsbD
MMKTLFIVLLGLCLSAPAAALETLGEEASLLEADAAFALNAEVVDEDTLRASWTIAPGYYLYKDKFRFSITTSGASLGEITLPPGHVKQDEFLGRVETYTGTLNVDIPYTRDATARTLDFEAIVQGCAEGRVCYPPHTQKVSLTLPAATPAPAPAAIKPSPLDKLKALAGEFGAGEDEFLPVDAAFGVEAVADGNGIRLDYRVASGYYLYKERLAFSLAAGDATLGTAQLPAGEIHEDEYFGRMEVYTGDFSATLPVTARQYPATVKLKLGYQGCAEAGLCYPPVTRELDIVLPQAQAVPTTDPRATTTAPVTEQERLVARLAGGALLPTLAAFFLAGLLLTFTPCVFPMIPILSSLIVGQGRQLTTARAFALSLAYVLAMALTYTAAGVIAGLFGQNLQAAFQNPWIIAGFSAVFVAFALAMFGLYDLQMPGAVQSHLSALSSRQQGGTLFGAAIMGLLSALIVGPCVAAPLAAALIVIGERGDPLLGGAALFALSLGMGAPLLAFGASAGRLLPRVGGWMNIIKHVFGVLLLALAVWMLERILPAALTLALWAALIIVSGIYLGALDTLGPDATGWRKLWKGVGLIGILWGALLLVGAASGGREVFQPLAGLVSAQASGAQAQAAEGLPFARIKGEQGLDEALASARAAGQPVMLDFYADWCVSCKELERYTFADPSVQAALSGALLLQTDVTANDAADQALMRRHKVIGPPSILFFGPDGVERKSHRLVGFMEAAAFSAHARAALAVQDSALRSE